MCLIIYSNPNAEKVSQNELFTAFTLNGDGTGISYVCNNKIVTKKDFVSFDEIYQYYSDIPIEHPILIHFRKSSAGAIIPENIHPFTCGEDAVWCINGTISKLNFKGRTESDCFIFHDLIISRLHQDNKEFYKNIGIQLLIESYIGIAKMVLLDKNGDYLIINENLGEWRDKTKKDTWFSNNLFKQSIEKETRKQEFETKRLERIAQHNNNLNVRVGVHNYNYIISKHDFYLINDKTYKKLSQEKLAELMRLHKCGQKKLKSRFIIGKMSNLTKQQLEQAKYKESETERYDAYWRSVGLSPLKKIGRASCRERV